MIVALLLPSSEGVLMGWLVQPGGWKMGDANTILRGECFTEKWMDCNDTYEHGV